MKPGDLVIDKTGGKWVIITMGNDFFSAAKFENHLLVEIMLKTEVVEHEPKPANVEWLFLARRAKNLKGLEALA